MARRGRGLGGLGIVLPVIGALTAGKAVAIGGAGVLAYALSRGKQGFAPATPLPAGNPCSSKRMKERLATLAASGVQGAATGASVAPTGAGVGVGAGAGLLTAALSDPNLAKCGAGRIKAAIQDTCRHADKAVREMRKKGVYVPRDYDRWSCEQRIAYAAAALTPSGLILGYGVSAGQATIDEAQRAADKAAKAVSHAASEAKKLGKKIGIGGLEDMPLSMHDIRMTTGMVVDRASATYGAGLGSVPRVTFGGPLDWAYGAAAAASQGGSAPTVQTVSAEPVKEKQSGGVAAAITSALATYLGSEQKIREDRAAASRARAEAQASAASAAAGSGVGALVVPALVVAAGVGGYFLLRGRRRRR